MTCYKECELRSCLKLEPFQPFVHWTDCIWKRVCQKKSAVSSGWDLFANHNKARLLLCKLLFPIQTRYFVWKRHSGIHSEWRARTRKNGLSSRILAWALPKYLCFESKTNQFEWLLGLVLWRTPEQPPPSIVVAFLASVIGNCKDSKALRALTLMVVHITPDLVYIQFHYETEKGYYLKRGESKEKVTSWCQEGAERRDLALSLVTWVPTKIRTTSYVGPSGSHLYGSFSQGCSRWALSGYRERVYNIPFPYQFWSITSS